MISVLPAALSELEGLLGDLINDRIAFEPAIKQLRALAERHDWDWFGLNPKPDFNWRAGLLFRAVTYSHYCAGRKAEFVEAGYPFRIFRADLDCGDEHQQLDGLTFTADHIFWQRYSPPLRWDCGCYLAGAWSDSTALRLGGNPERPLPSWTKFADPSTGLYPGLDAPWASGQPQLLDLLDAIARRAIPARP